MNSIPGRLIEPALPPGVPLASGRRQGKLRRAMAPTEGAKLQISRLPWRALAPFALRGPLETVP
ncbi:hypothetical protein [Oryzifoliimicrobium ureilyticus]|uniref:hypothetical protein n=1 Tax=Oryzifoliimicrobium ureilyticus TaxID=3113724 RepID=UPI00307614CE